MSESASAKPERRPTGLPKEPANSLDKLAVPGPDWSLPSGQSLVEFALRSGFLAPPLLGAGKKRRVSKRGRLGRTP
jgi:hypothetical protein